LRLFCWLGTDYSPSGNDVMKSDPRKHREMDFQWLPV
jgi:hypothetical protein